jgi:hypothetical protein
MVAEGVKWTVFGDEHSYGSNRCSYCFELSRSPASQFITVYNFSFDKEKAPEGA